MSKKAADEKAPGGDRLSAEVVHRFAGYCAADEQTGDARILAVIASMQETRPGRHGTSPGTLFASLVDALGPWEPDRQLIAVLMDRTRRGRSSVSESLSRLRGETDRHGRSYTFPDGTPAPLVVALHGGTGKPMPPGSRSPGKAGYAGVSITAAAYDETVTLTQRAPAEAGADAPGDVSDPARIVRRERTIDSRIVRSCGHLEGPYVRAVFDGESSPGSGAPGRRSRAGASELASERKPVTRRLAAGSGAGAVDVAQYYAPDAFENAEPAAALASLARPLSGVSARTADTPDAHVHANDTTTTGPTAADGLDPAQSKSAMTEEPGCPTVTKPTPVRQALSYDQLRKQRQATDDRVNPATTYKGHRDSPPLLAVNMGLKEALRPSGERDELVLRSGRLLAVVTAAMGEGVPGEVAAAAVAEVGMPRHRRHRPNGTPPAPVGVDELARAVDRVLARTCAHQDEADRARALYEEKAAHIEARWGADADPGDLPEPTTVPYPEEDSIDSTPDQAPVAPPPGSSLDIPEDTPAYPPGTPEYYVVVMGALPDGKIPCTDEDWATVARLKRAWAGAA